MKKPLKFYYILMVIIIISVILLVWKYNNQIISESFEEKNILVDNPRDDISTIEIINTGRIENSEIPLNIFITWQDKNLPEKMKENVEYIKSINPEFMVYLFDDKDCRNFIEKYFIKDVLDAFDGLIPGAYKADLWRYCILYKYGGVYQDIKLKPVNGFKYLDLLKNNKEYFVKDIDVSGGGIYNAFMICKSGNELLKKCICRIIENVKNKYYGNSQLDPTGPILMKSIINNDELNKIDLVLRVENYYDLFIVYKNIDILKMYDNYRNEQNKHSKTPYYGILWKEKKIYK